MTGLEHTHPPECPDSRRFDWKHSWRFDGDDPYIICVYCGELRDALTGSLVRPSTEEKP